MRKCLHLKCTGVRKKENDFIFEATRVWGKVLKNQFIFKGMARLTMHLLVPSAWLEYNIGALIFMHMRYVFFLQRKYGVHKKEMRFLVVKIINSTFYFHLLLFLLSLINYLWFIMENICPRKLIPAEGHILKPSFYNFIFRGSFGNGSKENQSHRQGLPLVMDRPVDVEHYDSTRQGKMHFVLSIFSLEGSQ